jgi:hypothetical protein
LARAAQVAGAVLWIGRACWPYPPALAGMDRGVLGSGLLDRSLFVDPGTHAERVWAIEQAARCRGAAAVIADGSGLSMAESRRLQLAAERRGAGRGVPVMLSRPSRERGVLSAARTRWLVAPVVTGAGDLGVTHRQEWAVELLRCKGMRPSAWGARRWVVRRDHATGRFDDWQACDGGLAPGVVDRSAEKAGSPLAVSVV